MLPKEKSKQFEVFGKEEVQIFKNHYFQDNTEKAKGPNNQWDDFKHKMVTLMKKWINFKLQLKKNNICKNYAEMDKKV